MIKKRVGIVIPFFISLVIQSLVGPANALQKVLFFAGYGADAQSVACWEKGAELNPDSAGFQFEGIPYPAHAKSDQASALSAGAATIRSWVDHIDAHPSDTFILVGHSSGSALAIAIASAIARPQNVTLVDLDGFTPPLALQKGVRTECFSSANGSLRSRNAAGMSTCLRHEILSAPWCQTSWCLHFSLVNAGVPANLDGDHYKKEGYASCSTNLAWLKDL